MKPTLFIGLEGPILIPSAHPDSALGLGIASYAKPFLHWAVQHFNVRWLTDRSPRDAIYVANLLSLPDERIAVAGFGDLKTEALQPRENFYWVDSELIPGEVSWLAQHGLSHRLLQADPVRGVTPELKDKLEALIRRR